MRVWGKELSTLYEISAKTWEFVTRAIRNDNTDKLLRLMVPSWKTGNERHTKEVCVSEWVSEWVSVCVCVCVFVCVCVHVCVCMWRQKKLTDFLSLCQSSSRSFVHCVLGIDSFYLLKNKKTKKNYLKIDKNNQMIDLRTLLAHCNLHGPVVG